MGICQAHYMPSPFSCSGCYSGQPHSFGPLYANCGYQQSWIVSRHCLGFETSRDRFFDVSVSVSDPTVSVSVSRSFLDFLETVSKRKSCSLVEAVSKVLVQTVFCSELRTVLRYTIVLCRTDN